MKRIPIKAAERIAKDYGYDQVVVIARKVGEGGGEHVTTYGVNKVHCESAALQGDALKKFMGWPVKDRMPMTERIAFIMRAQGPMKLDSLLARLCRPQGVERNQIDDIVYEFVESGQIRLGPDSTMYWI